jgi:DNA-3-methyladenine glycosylase
MSTTEQINIADLQPIPDEEQEAFFNGCVDEVAATLIGMFISNKVDGRYLGGQIIETEAYCQNDPAAHCHPDANKARKKESGPMSLSGGHIYVYPSRINFSKGTWCLNLTCGPSGFGSAVLIRSLRPTSDSIERMKKIRSQFMKKAPTEIDLCSGPGKLHEALGLIGPAYNGEPISKTSLRLHGRTDVDVPVTCGRRWGIPAENAAATWPRSCILCDDAVDKFLSPCAVEITKKYGRELFPTAALHELRYSGPLANCKCSSAVH